jgi:anti-anti-sigma factor
MSCFSHYHGEVLVIYPQDRRIDEEIARALLAELKGLVLGVKHRKVLINFENVTYVCSEMLGTLVRINSLCRSDAIALKFCGFAPVVKEIMKLSGMDRLLSTYGSETEALDAF